MKQVCVVTQDGIWYHARMIITPHAVTGAAIAVIFPYPVVCIPLSVASHFFLDTIPHWQETLPPYRANSFTLIRTVADIIVTGLCLSYIVSLHSQLTPVILLCAVAGVLPDSDVIIHQFRLQKIQSTGLFQKYWNWHCQIQRETSSTIGIIPQVAVVLIGLYIIHMFR